MKLSSLLRIIDRYMTLLQPFCKDQVKYILFILCKIFVMLKSILGFSENKVAKTRFIISLLLKVKLQVRFCYFHLEHYSSM